MSRPKMNNAEKLLRRMKRVGGMTRSEVLKYLQVLNGRSTRAPLPAGEYNSTLYGTSKVQGVLEAFCKKNKDGTFKVNKPLKAPFHPARSTTTFGSTIAPANTNLASLSPAGGQPEY